MCEDGVRSGEMKEWKSLIRTIDDFGDLIVILAFILAFIIAAVN